MQMSKKQTQTKKRNTKTKTSSSLGAEIIGISILGLALLVMASIFTDKVGLVGTLINTVAIGLFGIGGYILPFYALLLGWLYIKGDYDKLRDTLKYMMPLLVLIMSFFHLLSYGEASNISLLSLIYMKQGSYINGGWIGALVGHLLTTLLGSVGAYIVLAVLFGIWLLLVTQFPVFSWIQERLADLSQRMKEGRRTKKESLKVKLPKVKKLKENALLVDKEFEHPTIFLSGVYSSEESTNKDESWTPPITVETSHQASHETSHQEESEQVEDSKGILETFIDEEEEENDFESNAQAHKPYTFPSLDLLRKGETASGSKQTSRVSLSNAKKLEDTLASFGVEAKVIQIHKGPTVTRYELQPKQGVKVSKIVNLADDIALNLAATGIRIEAPIPGKSAVGIEVPNEKSEMVYLRDVIDSDNFAAFPSKLAFALGKDIAGKPMVTDIGKMPHILIAGATGSGKSVCINTMITSILYKARPDEVKLIMIDPKVVELNVYNGIPHLLIPVVTDPKKAAGALCWAVNEMTKRYNLFAENNVRDMKGYNAKAEENTPKMPHIVIIIDELADLMMTAAREVEDAICRLAQMARAAGIHLVIATQRPSVDVITGVIKANIPSRLAFAVSSGIDSRTILDSNGAEKLLGKGDMLFCPIGESKPIRIQGAFVSDKEVEDIVEAVKQTGEVMYAEEMIQSIDTPRIEIEGSTEDECLLEAIELAKTKEKLSISMLQRYFRIGFNRASRLMEALEAKGVVGPDEGSKPRKVLNNINE